MFKISEKNIGWIQGLFIVLVLWGSANVYMSYVTQILHVNKLVFAFITFVSCSFCLLIYAGDGKLSRETFRSTGTWVYGIVLISFYFLSLHIFSLTSATEASILIKLNVIFSIFCGAIFLGRKINRYQVIGMFCVLSGVLLVAKNLPVANAAMVYLLIILAGILQALRTFSAEFHKQHKHAANEKDTKSQCRVIGYVMFIVSILFGLIISLLSYLAHISPEAELDRYLITAKDLIHYPTILSAMLMGCVIYAPIRYLEFSVSEKIKTENFLTLGALTFVSTLFWEWATQSLTGLSLRTVNQHVLVAGGLITLGSFIMSLAKFFIKDKFEDYAQYLKVAPQNLTDIEYTREIIAQALEHFNSDKKRTATALEIPVEIIDAIFNDRQKQLAFRTATLKQVSANYRKNIASTDTLTGLLNRNGFMTGLKNASLESENLSLFFIDLNKFKPVNDTYGHEAGDYILQESGKRLKNLFPENSLITRLGGDEYCILLIDTVKKVAEEKINSILETLEQNFNYKENIINISGSIGLASFPEDTESPEELLEIADKQMYINKSER